MTKPTSPDIRETILRVVQDQHPRGPTDATLQQGTVLEEVRKRLGITHDTELECAVLTQWHDLFRTGYFAWGHNLTNPNSPFFHPTDRCRRALERLSRDPGNPAGYLKHLLSVSKLNPVARSYLDEGLECFNAGFHKSAAVMLGAAAESLVLELGDAIVRKLKDLGQAVPKGLDDWKLKTVLDSLQGLLDSKKNQFPKELREEFEAYWAAFAQQIRAARNDAGHPTSVDPVTPDGVHASFLVFPELARLSTKLNEWVVKDMK